MTHFRYFMLALVLTPLTACSGEYSSKGLSSTGTGATGETGNPNASKFTANNSGGDDGATGTGGTRGTGGTDGTGAMGGTGKPSSVLDLAMDDSGFTVFAASDDTRIIYVSSSDGDDKNDGLSEATPLATPGAGIGKLRDGMPDWLLFKRGDTFSSGIGHWKLSGRSPSEPMVIGAYGDADARPAFDSSGRTGISTKGGTGSPETTDNLAFVSLRFTNGGISWLRGGRNLLFEDCVFIGQLDFYTFDGFAIDNVKIYRSQVLDSYSTSAHAQGFYLDGVTNFTIEETLLDHNGWNEGIADAEPTIFNHNLYLQNGTDSSNTLKNNIVMRAASHGCQMRSGGRVEGNLFARNPINILIGGGNDPNPGGVDGWVIDNVVLEGIDMLPREGHGGNTARGWAIDLENIKTTEVSGNIVAHCLGSQCINIDSDANATYSNNIIWDWGGRMDESSGPFADSERNLATYMDSLGGDPTYEAFVENVRAQSKTNWRPAFTAAEVNQYIRDGFAN